MAAGTVAAYAAAVLLHYPELGVLAASGLLTLVLGVAWVLRRPNVRIERTIEPARVARGEVALGLLTVANPGHLAVSPTVAEERCGTTTVGVAIPRLAPGAVSRSTYRLPTARRAVLDVGPLVVARQDPFGCWRTSQRLGTTERLWVHPIVHPLGSLLAGRTRSLDGPDRDLLPHGSITFHALREYVPGDDLRHIHWRSSARVGTLMVREHVDTSLPRATLLFDVASDSYTESGFEQAVEVTASLAAAVCGERLPLRLVTTAGEAVDGSGRVGDGQAMLDVLAGVVRDADASLGALATRMAGERRGDVLLVVTGRAPAEDLAAVGALGARYGRGVVAVVADAPDAVAVPVPVNLRVLRLSKAADLPAMWELVARR